MVVTIIMLMLYGLGGKAGFDINAQKPNEDTGANLAGDVLSFGGIVFGSFTGVSILCLCINLPGLTNFILIVGSYCSRLQLQAPRDNLNHESVHPYFLRSLHSDYFCRDPWCSIDDYYERGIHRRVREWRDGWPFESGPLALERRR